MELSDEEFVRRFLLHVLPSGFMKIRHYGFLSNKGRDERLEICRKILKTVKSNFVDLLKKEAHKIFSCCPDCGNILFGITFSSPRYQRGSFANGLGP
jgi:hypothetical protein